MKPIIFLILLLFSSIFESKQNSSTTKLIPKTRVLLIGIDGLLQKCYDSADTSAFSEIISNGSSSFMARTAIEAFSAPGWSNILCGMNTETTGITNNDWAAPWISNKTNPITPISGNHQPIPCLFERIKKQNPQSRTAAFFSWDWFVNLGNESIPNSIDTQYFCQGDDMDKSIVCDKEAADKAKEIISNDFDFFFLFLGSLDMTGHATKFCSTEYIDRLSGINSLLKDIFDHMKAENIFDNTNIIITSDHGANYLGYNHGDQNNDNILVPFIIKGPNIKNNYLIKNPLKNVDIAATIITIFNLDIPSIWTSNPIQEVFKENEKESINSSLINSENGNNNLSSITDSHHSLKFLNK